MSHQPPVATAQTVDTDRQHVMVIGFTPETTGFVRAGQPLTVDMAKAGFAQGPLSILTMVDGDWMK
ncbi:hypothetical protein ABZ502_17625 [Streptomyces abikoensis]|uniref:hypothetical protein n=1 Tax=Streptomyces abikoensis TaxID=97398 RepID=UPI0033EA4A73